MPRNIWILDHFSRSGNSFVSIGNFHSKRMFRIQAMTRSIRNTIALGIIVFYLPLVTTIEFLHTDAMPAGNKPCELHDGAARAFALSSHDDGVCFACLFAVGQIFSSDSPTISTSFEHYVSAQTEQSAVYRPAEHLPARAPPRLSFS